MKRAVLVLKVKDDLNVLTMVLGMGSPTIK